MAGDGQRVSPFESIKHVDEADEFWSARELSKLLSYSLWQNFDAVIERAKTACTHSGHKVEDRFIDVNRVIEGDRWGKQTISDVQVSRYACYLVVQNADPSRRGQPGPSADGQASA
jgi:DNA-damage-inducible protein D